MAQLTEWFRDCGDATHRLNYDLNERSIVVDLGGYEGKWTQKIVNRYECNAYLFEPIPHFMRTCQGHLSHYPKISFFPYAIGEKNGKENITVAADSSSIFGGGAGAQTVEIEVIDVAHFLNLIPVQVDLIKVNIEGGEYHLLTMLQILNQVRRFRDIQVQFHTFVPNATVRRTDIREHLSKTHHITYDYEFVWENWRLNGT
jgi:FkbM family methyltransferase